MAGSIGFSTGTTANDSSVNITTDSSGNVSVTTSPNKADGTPNTAIPPSMQLKGTGPMPNPAPGPGSKTGAFVVRAGDPLYVKIECLDNCDVVVSLWPNPDSAGAALWTITFPHQDELQKQILISLLKQAASDAAPKPAAPKAPVKAPLELKPPAAPGPKPKAP
jgi:hypothetical protein